MKIKLSIIVFLFFINHFVTAQNNAPQTFYTCVMHPEIHSPKPGKCPKCGMALVKEKAKPIKKAVVKKPVATKKVISETKKEASKPIEETPKIVEVPKDDEILVNEVFGPVAPIVLFDTDEEALKMANDTEYGLISYVYSEDLKRAIRFAEALEAGMVAINRGMVSDPAAPFGGVKQSGLGREGGFDGIHEFLQTKYIGVEI